MTPDEKVDKWWRVWRQIIGTPTRPDYERHDQVMAELNREHVGISIAKRDEIERAIRWQTLTMRTTDVTPVRARKKEKRRG